MRKINLVAVEKDPSIRRLIKNVGSLFFCFVLNNSYVLFGLNCLEGCFDHLDEFGHHRSSTDSIKKCLWLIIII